VCVCVCVCVCVRVCVCGGEGITSFLFFFILLKLLYNIKILYFVDFISSYSFFIFDSIFLKIDLNHISNIIIKYILWYNYFH